MNTLLFRFLGSIPYFLRSQKSKVSPLQCSKKDCSTSKNGRGEGSKSRTDKKIQVAPFIPRSYFLFLQEESERTGISQHVIISENIEEALYFCESDYEIYLQNRFTLFFDNTYFIRNPLDSPVRLKRQCYGATYRVYTRLTSKQYADLKAFALAADVSVSRAASILLQIGLRHLDYMYRSDSTFDFGYAEYGNRSLQSSVFRPR